MGLRVLICPRCASDDAVREDNTDKDAIGAYVAANVYFVGKVDDADDIRNLVCTGDVSLKFMVLQSFLWK